MDCGPLFSKPRFRRGDFHRSTVKAYRFYLDSDDASELQSFKNSLQNTVFTPSVHAYIYSMPILVFFRQCSPFAAVFRNIQYRIDQLEITHTYISTLARKIFFDLFILLLCNIHDDILSRFLSLFSALCEHNLKSVVFDKLYPKSSLYIYDLLKNELANGVLIQEEI